MVDSRNRDTSFFTEIVDGSDFRFGLEPWHEPTTNSSHKLNMIDKSDKISLDDENSSSVEEGRLDKLIMHLMEGP